MRKRHALQLLPVVERLVRELGNGRMHASLLVKDAPAGVRTRFVKAFEQRVAAIFQPDVPQQEVGHGSFFRTLLGNGRQLFVVAHQYELVDGVMLLMTGRQDTYQVGFQNLRGFVDDGQLEMLQREQVEAVVDGGRGTHKDTCACHLLLDVGQLGTVIQAVFQQVRHETLVARQFVADTDERGTVGNAGIREHGTDFIHCPVGVRQQQDRGVRFAQGFFHHEAQGTRGFSGTRRTY